MKNFINTQIIETIIEETKNPVKERVEKIIEKAKQKKGLTVKEASYLLNTDDQELLEKMFVVAKQIKLEIYGTRIVFFAPLYISNYCVNNCSYCGFHTSNSELPRKKLTLKQVKEQTQILINMGHKRLLLEFGEHPVECPIDYVIDVIKTIYATKSGKGEIRRVNLNIAATSAEDYRKLKEVGIGTYQLFQETYHLPTYQKLHQGLKADYERQLFAHDRAMIGGIDDLGLGVLFGLYDYKFDVLALLIHAQYLNNKYNVGPHTISVPRFNSAETVDIELSYQVSDNDFLKIIAILRMTVPYTGMIISTREAPEIRAKAFELGISQASAASSTEICGYKRNKKKTFGQFSLHDHRSVDEVLQGVIKQGFLPSFCTACYRLGRTGEDFMDLAKKGIINKMCQPNAILTFKEYLEDYASRKTEKLGRDLIIKEMKFLNNPEMEVELKQRLKRIEAGERDLYF